MLVPLETIQETEARLTERKPVREDNLRKMRSKMWLEVDTPNRVRKRLQRLGRVSGGGGKEPGPPDSWATAGWPSGTVQRVGELTITIRLDQRGGNDGTAGAGPHGAGAVTDETDGTEFLERIFGENNLISVSFLAAGLTVAATVGRVHMNTAEGRYAGFGTGFLVSPRLLITNNHVIGDAGSAARTLVEFNYQEGPDGQLQPSVIFNLDPQAFFVTDKPLDYTLVAVKETAPNGTPLSSFGWNRLIEGEGKILLGEYVNLIQHPLGGLKQLALRENRLIDLLENFLHYDADTAAGSSGAPVFNDQWEVVGLHHSAAAKRDEQGRILSKEGTPWSSDRGEERIDWIANEGVRISRILQNLKSQSLSTDTQRRLRSEVFDLDSPLPTPPPPR
jgi:endonuclease G, mitochondrial